MTSRPLDAKGYPVKPCDAHVEGGTVAYPCRLPEGHEGPCEAIELPRSAARRRLWEKAQSDEERALLEIPDAPVVDPAEPEKKIPAHLLDGTRRKDVHLLSPPSKQREGDQPLPIKNSAPYVADVLIERLRRAPDGDRPIVLRVCEMLEERKALGIERYGTPLQAFNGRDVVRDATEECLDLVTYLFQAILEGKSELIEYFNNAARILTSLVSYQEPDLKDVA